MPASIEDYALIGDCETVALVCAAGSIDWLCPPRFDSPACLAALLGTAEAWALAAGAGSKRGQKQTFLPPRHHGAETIFDHPEGVVAIVDYMPVRQGTSDSSARANLIRIVFGRRGRVRMRMDLTLRFDYGATVPWVTRLAGEHGIRAVAGPAMAVLRTPVPLQGKDLSTVAEFTVEAGQATRTLRALMAAGYCAEAQAWRGRQVRAVAGSPEQAQIMYGVGGERHLWEWELDWLRGYRGARPVRVGNLARTQHMRGSLPSMKPTMGNNNRPASQVLPRYRWTKAVASRVEAIGHHIRVGQEATFLACSASG
ncbi:trehalase-like domain-containing protein [Cupriavidus numazuensis]|uniref:Trehalase-like N-terminal domain-containing protein n=1 Tax=Cupriavidus numazuensis TaxID=221992 RepID=A0ABM8TMR2_9BURK|nr:hypothetical protein LMG26411_04879 [Cupriavidus numazuensis]